jgi:hypothetical protein
MPGCGWEKGVVERGHLRGQELIIDIFNPCGAHNEAVLAACYFSAFSPT